MLKAFCALLLIAGTANLQQALAVSLKSGSVTFYRPAGYYGRLAKITVYCDGKEVAKLGDRRRITVAMTAETHQCYDKRDEHRKTEPLVFELRENEELFIQVSWEAPTSLLDGTRPQLMLQKAGWYPDTNDPQWREMQPLK